MIYETTIDTGREKIHFEFCTYPQATMVALNATLDDFKGFPVMGNTGKPSVRFAERTVKDCTAIDGCIYMHLGRVDDSRLVELIGIFLKAIGDKSIWKPKGMFDTTFEKTVE